MIFTAFDFPVVVFEGMMSSKDLKAGGNILEPEIPGLVGEKNDRMTFARSLESSLEGIFSKRKSGSGEEIAGNSNADVTPINESDPGNADIMLSLLIESARTAATPDENQFDHTLGGPSASRSGGMIGEILSKILKMPDPKLPFATDRFFTGRTRGNDTLQALVEKFGQGAAKPLSAEDAGTQDQLKHLIASLSKAVENSNSQMRHVGSASMDEPDLRQLAMSGFAPDRVFAVKGSGNDALQASVEVPGRSYTTEDGKIQDQLRHLIASLSKAVENSDSQMRHVGSASTDEPDLRQTEMTGKLRVNMHNNPQNGNNAARIGISPKETRDSLKESTAAASEKADAQLRGFLNSLAREANPPNQAQRDSRSRPGSKMSGFKGSEANLEKEQSILKNITSVGPGGLSPLGKVGAASFGEFNLQSGLSDGTGERSGEKPVASPLDTARPGASFEKSLQQPVENKIVGQIFMRLFSGARQGSGNMTINIYPPEMGSVKIRIISDNGRLTVHMHPGNQQVAGILEKNLGVLQQSLQDQGLDVSDLFVSVDTGEQERSDFEQQSLMQGTGKKGGRLGGKDSHEDQDPSPPVPHDPWLMDGHTLSLRV